MPKSEAARSREVIRAAATSVTYCASRAGIGPNAGNPDPAKAEKAVQTLERFYRTNPDARVRPVPPPKRTIPLRSEVRYAEMEYQKNGCAPALARRLRNLEREKSLLRAPAREGDFSLSVVDARGENDEGTVTVEREGGAGRLRLVVRAKLTPTLNRQGYEVWLYNTQKDVESIGAAVTDLRGHFVGAGPLPGDYRRFRYVDVSLEQVDQNRAHSGYSVLRGELTAPWRP